LQREIERDLASHYSERRSLGFALKVPFHVTFQAGTIDVQLENSLKIW
jgi:hypothetical protein